MQPSLSAIEVSGACAMCFGIPMQIRSIDGFLARCEAKGIEREASLFMLQDDLPVVGDFVVVHLGYAVERATAEEAAAAWAVYDELLAAADASAAETGST